MLLTHSTISAKEEKITIPTFKIFIDNEELELTTAPYVQKGITMVPFRSFLTKLGFDVTWDAEHKQVTATDDEITLVLTIDSVYAKVNDKTEILPLPPIIKHGTTYIPLRFIGTASGGSLELYGGAYNAVWMTTALQEQLTNAVYVQNISEVEKLLQAGANPTVKVGPAGPVIYGVANGSLEIFFFISRIWYGC